MSEYITLIPLVIMLGGLTISVIRDNYIGKTQKRIMLAIIPLVALLLVQNCGDYICQTAYNQPADLQL